MKVIGWIKSLFHNGTYYQDSVERFLKQKNPTNTAELETWLKQFERDKLYQRGFL